MSRVTFPPYYGTRSVGSVLLSDYTTYSLKSDVAAGVDGVTWEMYAEGLGDRLTDLHGRLHRGGAYRAPPVRRVEIPKPDGGKRPLGIATLEDKNCPKGGDGHDFGTDLRIGVSRV